MFQVPDAKDSGCPRAPERRIPAIIDLSVGDG